MKRAAIGEAGKGRIYLRFGTLENDVRRSVRTIHIERDICSRRIANGQGTFIGRIEGDFQEAGTRRLIVIDVIDGQTRHRQISVLIDRKSEVDVGDDGRVIDRVDQDVHRLSSGVGNAIGDDVSNLRESAEVNVIVGVKRERDGAVGGDGDLSLAIDSCSLTSVVDRRVTVDGERLDRQRVVIRVGRVSENVQIGATFFSRGKGLILSDRDIVDLDRERAVGRRIRGAIGKDVADDWDDADVVQRAADETSTWRVREGAVGVDLYRTLVVDERGRIAGGVIGGVAGDREGSDAQGVEVDIRVVRGDAAVQRDARTDGVGVVRSDRQVIDRRDGDGERGGGGEVTVILQRVGDDRDGTVPVGDRREGEGTVGVEGQVALAGDGDRGASRVDRRTAGDRVADNRQGCARFAPTELDIRVVGKNATRDGGNRIFRTRNRIVDANRGIVNRRDRDREGAGAGSARGAVVLDRVSDRRSRAVPIRDWGVDIGTISLDRERGHIAARAGGAQSVIGSVEGNIGHLAGRTRRHQDIAAGSDADGRHRERVVFRVGVVQQQVA